MTLLLGNAMPEKNAPFKLFIFGQEEKGINGSCYKAVIPTALAVTAVLYRPRPQPLDSSWWRIVANWALMQCRLEG